MVVSAVASQDFFSQEFHRKAGGGRSCCLNTEIHQSKQHAHAEQEKVKFITDFYYVHIVIAVIFRDSQRTHQ